MLRWVAYSSPESGKIPNNSEYRTRNSRKGARVTGPREWIDHRSGTRETRPNLALTAGLAEDTGISGDVARQEMTEVRKAGSRQLCEQVVSWHTRSNACNSAPRQLRFVALCCRSAIRSSTL